MDRLSPFRKINIAKGVGCQEERGIHGGCNGWGVCPPALFRAGGNENCLISMVPIIPIVMVRIAPIVIIPIIAMVIVVIIPVMISITPGQG